MKKSTLALGWGWRGKLYRSLVSKNTSNHWDKKPPRIEIVTNILGLPRLLHTWQSYLDHLYHKHAEWVYIVYKNVGCWWNLNGANTSNMMNPIWKNVGVLLWGRWQSVVNRTIIQIMMVITSWTIKMAYVLQLNRGKFHIHWLRGSSCTSTFEDYLSQICPLSVL